MYIIIHINTYTGTIYIIYTVDTDTSCHFYFFILPKYKQQLTHLSIKLLWSRKSMDIHNRRANRYISLRMTWATGQEKKPHPRCVSPEEEQSTCIDHGSILLVFYHTHKWSTFCNFSTPLDSFLVTTIWAGLDCFSLLNTWLQPEASQVSPAWRTSKHLSLLEHQNFILSRLYSQKHLKAKNSYKNV